MSKRTIVHALRAAVAAGLSLLLLAPAAAQTDPARLVADAQTTLGHFIRDPDQTWVHDNIGRAKALLIVPQIVKAGFIFGGSGCQGVLVDRSGKHDLGQLRALQDWFLRYQLKTVPDIAEVASVGGMERAWQIVPDPSALAARGITVAG